MSNEDLYSRVSSLRSELHSIQSENSRLQSEIDAIVAVLVAATTTLVNTRSRIRTSLGESNASLSQSHQMVVEAYEIQQKTEETYKRLKNMEAASQEIRACNDTMYYDFEVYRTVRKIVQGIMDNIDFSFVSLDQIEEVVGEEHLQSPDYWLTPLLIALVAWHRDERDRAQRALERSLSLNKPRTAAFLFVFCLRIGREEVALKWFEELIHQRLMGSDKTMVLLFCSLLVDTLEEDVTDLVSDRVRAYIQQLINESIAHSQTSRTEAIERICGIFQSFANNFDFPYPQITQYASNAEDLKQSLALARNNGNIISFVADTLNVDDGVRNEFLKLFIDEIVAEPSAPEKDIFEKIRRNELIIQFQGDKDQAEETYRVERAYEDAEFDIVAEMINWIYTKEGRAESNPQLRKAMFLLTLPLQQEAAHSHTSLYRALFNSSAHVSLNGFEGTVDMSNPEASDAEIDKFFQERAEEEKRSAKNTLAYVLMGVGGAAVVGGIVAIILLHAPLALRLMPIVVGFILLIVSAGILGSNKAKKRLIDLKCQQQAKATKAIVKGLGAEFAELQRAYDESDAFAEELDNRLADSRFARKEP